LLLQIQIQLARINIRFQISVMDWVINWCYIVILLIITESIIVLLIVSKIESRVNTSSWVQTVGAIVIFACLSIRKRI
jgi:hypothetical protein